MAIQQDFDDHPFDHAYWQEHWDDIGAESAARPENPYLEQETGHLPPGDALDAGCGAGAESIWLAQRQWRVTAVDISGGALDVARSKVGRNVGPVDIDWQQVDLTTWEPQRQWDLVVTNYAHATVSQLDLYRRLAEWVAPGGTLLIVAHGPQDSVENAHHPSHACVAPSEITGIFEPMDWLVEVSREATRPVYRDGEKIELYDVIVRARRIR